MSGSSVSPQAPWVSFCIATYRRPDRLERTLRAIGGQSWTDFEVIVSDNDPEGSAGPIVEAIADGRVRYSRNAENVGMIRNFNAALRRAEGDYVVFITDDDPVYPQMLATLRKLWLDYPGYGMYYGACEVLHEDQRVARAYGGQQGIWSALAPVPPGTVRTFSAEEFPLSFLRGRVFPYMLWSTGIVRRDVALAIGGLPDYGSPHLADHGYVLLAGAQAGCATTNVALGRQTIHNRNSTFGRQQFGRSELDDLKRGAAGWHRLLATHLRSRPDWPAIARARDAFVANVVLYHAAVVYHFYRPAKADPAARREFDRTLDGLFELPYLRARRWHFWLRTHLRVLRLPLRTARRLRYVAAVTYGRMRQVHTARAGVLR
jgi:glycosyltransferase involved in cell wall biosynthesis